MHTGEKAQLSGVYKWIRHLTPSRCQPTANERLIPLSQGETFPPCKSCQTGCEWELERKT